MFIAKNLIPAKIDIKIETNVAFMNASLNLKNILIFDTSENKPFSELWYTRKRLLNIIKSLLYDAIIVYLVSVPKL